MSGGAHELGGAGVLFAVDAHVRVRELIRALGCLDAAYRRAPPERRLPILVDYNNATFALPLMDWQLPLTVRTRESLPEASRRVGNIQKVVAALHSPFARTIVLDADTCVLRSIALPHMLAPLEHFDFVSTWSCCARMRGRTRSNYTEPLYGTGWEPNAGVFAVSRRPSSLRLLRAWWREFDAHYDRYNTYTSKEQQALLEVFARSGAKYSFFPMPATFNLRPMTTGASPASPIALGGPHAVHIYHHHLKPKTSARAKLRRWFSTAAQVDRRNGIQLSALERLSRWRHLGGLMRSAKRRNGTAHLVHSQQPA